MVVVPENTTSFRHQLIISLLLHLAVILVFTVKTFLFPNKPMIIEQTIRVDMVDLPDKLKTGPTIISEAKPEKKVEAAPVNAEPAPTPKPKVTTKEKTKSAKEIRDEALKRFKAIESLRNAEDREVQQKTKEIERKLEESAKQTYKGNVLSKGSSPTGTAALQHENYSAEIGAYVKRQWSLPEWLKDASLSAEVVIKIDHRGYIIHRNFVRSSGNPTFDGLVISTLEKSSPLPPPPNNLAGFYESEGIVLLFP